MKLEVRPKFEAACFYIWVMKRLQHAEPVETGDPELQSQAKDWIELWKVQPADAYLWAKGWAQMMGSTIDEVGQSFVRATQNTQWRYDYYHTPYDTLAIKLEAGREASGGRRSRRTA